MPPSVKLKVVVPTAITKNPEAYRNSYITLRGYVTLHYITLHRTTWHDITLHYITLHYITLHYITLHYITLHYITLHYITLHYITLHYITLHYITLHYITLHYITLHYITLHRIERPDMTWCIYLLLAECEVRMASYGPSFFLPKTRKEKTRVHNLPYGPSKRG